ncbi:MAG: trehalose operon repressor [Tissierellia bacterium]|nr:trehalose operon repressor [Tissierellia bacterium]
MKALYIKIYEDIKELIKSNRLLPGQTIESEKTLMKKYNCSRDTVRKATSLLQNNDLIIKSQGKSSIVAENRQYLFPTSSLESFKELKEKNSLDAKTIFLSSKLLDRSTLNINSQLQCQQVLEVKRIREINGEKIVLDIDYFDPSFVAKISKEVAENSIYEYLENDLGLSIAYAKKIVTVESPSHEERELLGLSKDMLLVQVASDTYLKDGPVFQHSISKHRHDKFIFTSYAER